MGRPRDVEKRRFWAAQLGAWERSGLNQAEFCRRQGLRRRLFSTWKRRLGVAAQERPSPVRFLPVAVRAQPEAEPIGERAAPGAALTVVTRGGYRIEVGEAFSPATLTKLLTALGSS